MASIPARHDHLAEAKRTLYLATPVILGQVSAMGMNFVDTVMAGRLPDNEVALAALGIGGSVWSAFLLFVLGCLMAVQPTVAQLDGAGRQAEGGAAARQALWVALLLAVPFTLVTLNGAPILRALEIDEAIIPTADAYLKALSWGAPAMCLVFLLRYFSEGSGRTRPTMYIGFMGVALNIPLNWVLMYGKFGMPALGAVGCGYATAIVIWLQVALLLLYINWHSHYRPFKLFERLEPPDRERLGDFAQGRIADCRDGVRGGQHVRGRGAVYRAPGNIALGRAPGGHQFLLGGFHDPAGRGQRHHHPGGQRDRAGVSRKRPATPA